MGPRPVGKRPLACFNRGYKWTYLYGFICPQSGEIYWLILPTVSVELFSMALQEFAKEVGAGEDKHILVVLGPGRLAYREGARAPRRDTP